MKMRVADYIMLRLEEAGVRHVFQVTGRGALFLSDALAKNEILEGVSLHHEQSCAFAAVAYAERSRGLGACMVSTGCAATNAMTGVLSAWQDGVSCIFISGQNILEETTRHTGIKLRTFGQQEADIVSLVTPITKRAIMLERAEDIGKVMDELLLEAQEGRKGPVWLDVPLDIQSSMIDANTLGRSAFSIERPTVSHSQVQSVINDISKAKRPVVLIGKGIRLAGADMLLASFVENWGIPLVYTPSAPDIYGASNELSIGSLGAMGCSRAGNFVVQNADYVLVLGSRLTSIVTGTDFCSFARDAKISVVDIDLVEHSKKGIDIDSKIQADLYDFLLDLNEIPSAYVEKDWQNKCKHWKKIFGCVEEDFCSKGKVDLYQLADRLSRIFTDKGALITDSGLVEVILPSNMSFAGEVDAIHPASQGAMGFALPAAIGAYYGGDGMVLAVIGDGSVMMNLQELESIRYQKLPIKIIVINNNVYSIIRRRQKDLFRKRLIGTDPSNGVSSANFRKLAESFDFEYQRIEGVKELDQGLKSLFAANGPVLCEILGREDQGYIELGQAKSEISGRFVRRPLEDQTPFLPRELFLEEMIIEPINQ